jgi:hypothetical protein
MVNVDNFPDQVADKEAVIASSSQTSTIIDCRGTSAAIFYIPAGFQSSSISFQVSHDKQNFFNLLDNKGSPVTVSVVAGYAAYINPSILSCVQYLKIVTSDIEVSQRTINIGMRRFQ